MTKIAKGPPRTGIACGIYVKATLRTATIAYELTTNEMFPATLSTVYIVLKWRMYLPVLGTGEPE